jgi:predicted component of type VI protein secretion system
MNVRLIVEHGGPRKVVPLQGSEWVLGRAHGNTVRIPSPEVSRQHCRLRLDNGLVTVEDMESVNGTFLNGRPVKSAEVVQPGDQIEVGPVTFIVEYELSPQARAKLRGMKRSDQDVEVLEALADGAALDEDEIPMLEAVNDPLGLNRGEEELPEVEVLRPPTADAAGELLKADFDFESPWQMPNGGDLRDILAQMEDVEVEEEQPTKLKKPKKK